MTKSSDDWIEKQDPGSGRMYYVNAVTGERSWEKPAALRESSEPASSSQAAQGEEEVAPPPVSMLVFGLDKIIALLLSWGGGENQFQYLAGSSCVLSGQTGQTPGLRPVRPVRHPVSDPSARMWDRSLTRYP